MSKEKVFEHITELLREIEGLDECDESTKKRLASLTAEIRVSVDSGDTGADWVDMARKVKSNVEQFEFAHPVLTSTVDRIMNTLSGMGI